MLEPFEGSADNRGILTVGDDEIRHAVARASDAGIACAVHAIGDRANRIVLDAFEATRGAWQPRGLRQRVEHVQVVHPDDIPRFGTLGVIASVQPIHATQDMDLVDRLWGTRGRGAYAFRSLLDAGAKLAFGSDAPVETPDPLAGLYAAVTRRRPDGRPEGGWYPVQCLSVEEATHAYAAGAAYAAGRERDAGHLMPGKYADFVALSDDVMSGDPDAILRARVTLTVVDGQLAWRAT
jgi:predicted amidohydrolase YtcJ